MIAPDAASLAAAITRIGLEAQNEREIVERLAALIQGAGIDLSRMAIGTDFLSPTADGRMFVWTPEGVTETPFDSRTSDADAVARDSPFGAMWLDRSRFMRHRLENGITGFGMLDRLREAGATDYLALRCPVASTHGFGAIDDVMLSFVTAQTGGFDEAAVRVLEALADPVALAFSLAVVISAARMVTTTYLGRAACDQVFAGNILRGRADPLDAVVWSSDLVAFTKISDRLATRDLLALLNDYAGALAEAIHAHGGEVLKFIGDGLLAVFPERETGAAAAALAAARRAEDSVAALNAMRASEGLVTTEFYLALHKGELLFGNFGAAERLDFTVLGPAVNETTRMLSLSKTVDQRIVASKAFADALGPGAGALVSVGRYALRGIGAPQDLYTLDRSR